MEVAQRSTLQRQAAYRLFGALLLYPEAERLEKIAEGTEWLRRELDKEELTERFGGPDRIAELLEQIRAVQGDLESLQADWVQLFGVSRDAYCYPYEGAYVESEASMQLIGELETMYARSGLVLTVKDLPDNVSVQFEFMSFLCEQLLSCMEQSENGLGTVLKRQRDFLGGHLGKWFPLLAKRVEEKDTGFYSLVCRAAKEMIESDQRYLQ
jgi:TorA maturation chaperone TorD